MGRIIVSDKDRKAAASAIEPSPRVMFGSADEGGGAIVAAPPEAAHTATASPEQYTERLVKFIPAEVITLFVTLDAIVKAAGGELTVAWVAFVACIIATPTYLYFGAKDQKPSWLHLLVSTLSFIVWALAFSTQVAGTLGFTPLVMAVVLPIFTFFAALIKP